MCELPVAIGNNEPWKGWPVCIVDSNPQDGEINIRLSGERPDQSVGKEEKIQHLTEKLLTKHVEKSSLACVLITNRHAAFNFTGTSTGLH